MTTYHNPPPQPAPQPVAQKPPVSTEAKSDMEVLFPEEVVEGYKIRPWGLGEIAGVSPFLLKALKAARDAGADVMRPESHVPELALGFASYAPDILSRTLKISKEEAESLPTDKALVILLAVLSQNIEYLKNSLGLGSVIERIKGSLSGP